MSADINNPDNKTKFISWEEAKAKSKTFLSNFSIEEKSHLMYGTSINTSNRCVGQIHPIKSGFFAPEKFPGIKLDDGPTGPRFQKGLTNSWPTCINLSSTFNRNLIYQIGQVQGSDFYHKGINVALTPCINLLRVPVGGRIFEAWGENPFLTGEMASELIRGIQSRGVIACAKHFIANEQEKYRNASNSVVDERTLMEIYVEPFNKAIKKGDVGCIMCAYNAVNGVYMYKNQLMKDVLKNKLGFNGFIVSDWWAVYSDTPDSINNGLDMNMPGNISKIPFLGSLKFKPSYWSSIPDQIKKNLITEEKLNDSAERIISTLYRFGQMENFPKTENFDTNYITEETKKLNRRAATESMVLLKNDDNILPINLKQIDSMNKKYKIGIFGIDAFKGDFFGQEGNIILTVLRGIKLDGHIVNGIGSSQTDMNYVVVPIEGIREKTEKYKNIELKPYAQLDKKGNEDIENSKKVAMECDIALVFVQTISGEDMGKNTADRKDLDVMHNGNKLIEEISEVNQNTVVIINSPGPVNLEWRDKVKSIIFGGLAGPESGNAIADILFGDANPSGHLPFVMGRREQYPADVKELPSEFGMLSDSEQEIKDTVKYEEGLFIGQYWFDKKKEIPYYYFGHGLLYTKFEFGNLDCIYNKNEKKLEVKFSIKNIGEYDGGVVAFLYLGFPFNDENYPERMLKGFDKYFLKVNEIKDCCIVVEEHDLSYYDINSKDYVLPQKGSYKVFVGQSADINDLCLQKEVLIE